MNIAEIKGRWRELHPNIALKEVGSFLNGNPELKFRPVGSREDCWITAGDGPFFYDERGIPVRTKGLERKKFELALGEISAEEAIVAISEGEEVGFTYLSQGVILECLTISLKLIKNQKIPAIFFVDGKWYA